jgi:hypothetical protein
MTFLLFNACMYLYIIISSVVQSTALVKVLEVVGVLTNSTFTLLSVKEVKSLFVLSLVIPVPFSQHYDYVIRKA